MRFSQVCKSLVAFPETPLRSQYERRMALKLSRAGVDWEAVEHFNSVDEIYVHFVDPELPPDAGQKSLFSWPKLKKLSVGRKPKRKRPQTGKRSLVGENGTLNTAIFGRAKGWGGPDDLENATFGEDGEGRGQHICYCTAKGTSADFSASSLPCSNQI